MLVCINDSYQHWINAVWAVHARLTRWWCYHAVAIHFAIWTIVLLDVPFAGYNESIHKKSWSSWYFSLWSTTPDVWGSVIPQSNHGCFKFAERVGSQDDRWHIRMVIWHACLPLQGCNGATAVKTCSFSLLKMLVNLLVVYLMYGEMEVEEGERMIWRYQSSMPNKTPLATWSLLISIMMEILFINEETTGKQILVVLCLAGQQAGYGRLQSHCRGQLLLFVPNGSSCHLLPIGEGLVDWLPTLCLLMSKALVHCMCDGQVPWQLTTSSGWCIHVGRTRSFLKDDGNLRSIHEAIKDTFRILQKMQHPAENVLSNLK